MADYKPTLQKKYFDEIRPELKKDYQYPNDLAVPRLEKIVINQGWGSAVNDRKVLDKALEELALITGQKAVPTYAKRSVSSFRLRQGMPIGAKVTLRRDRMYEFLERLISIALPRVRDFQGITRKGFDGQGNYTFGVTEQIIFPEINIDNVEKINGMDITFVTSAKSDQEAFELLYRLGLPFAEKN